MLNVRQLLASPRARSESLWVVLHKGIEFVLTLGLLKLLTNLLSKGTFGEYQLGLTTLVLINNVFEQPISQAYLRQYHTAAGQGASRSALLQTMRWLRTSTVFVCGACFLLSWPLAALFGLERFTIVAIGLIFLTNRWRSLRVNVLNIQRERRQGMAENLGFLVLQILLSAAGLLLISRTATTGLLAYATAAAVFGSFSRRKLRANLEKLPEGAPAPFASLVYTYGLSLGILTTCQWLQMFAERYVLGIQLDLITVGRYVAAYQVCGFPFMMMNTVLTALVLPVAFQRARDISNPAQLWSADRLLLAGVGVYLAAGVAIVAGYAAFGPFLLRLLTSKAYVLSAGTLTLIAAARLLIFCSLTLHMFFKVHQQTRFLLLYSVIGGVIAVGIAWFLISAHHATEDAAITAASLAVLITAVIYNLMLMFAPGGLWQLLCGVRSSLARARREMLPVAGMQETGV
jgi:O-antigen/teichoic acid export membrane protein